MSLAGAHCTPLAHNYSVPEEGDVSFLHCIPAAFWVYFPATNSCPGEKKSRQGQSFEKKNCSESCYMKSRALLPNEGIDQPVVEMSKMCITYLSSSRGVCVCFGLGDFFFGWLGFFGFFCYFVVRFLGPAGWRAITRCTV